jgi:phage terminase small subunit
MPRPRTPTNLLILNGGLAHDKKRYANRTTEPVPSGDIGPAPKHLSPAQKAIWKELLKQVPDGVLTNADRIIFELACRLTHKMRTEEFTSSNAAQLVSCLSRLGLSPADRSKVQVDPSKGQQALPPSPFLKFAPQ